MKNLLTEKLERLENLSKRAPIIPKDTPKCERWRSRGYYHQSLDWGRIGRWLESHVGRPWDEVVSEFVKLSWVPAQNRSYSHLVTHHVEANTLMVGKDIGYFYKYNYLRNNLRLIKDELRKTLYVHPVKRTLEVFVPKGKRTRHKEWLASRPKEFVVIDKTNQLQKIDGVWYLFWLENYDPKSEWFRYREIDHKKPFTNHDIKDFQLKIGEKQRVYTDYRGWRQVCWEPIYRTIPGPKVRKDQAESKLLKRLGLHNDPKPIKYGRLK